MDEETYSTAQGPECPYCNHHHEDDGGHFYDESFTELDCESCGKEMLVTTHVEWTWWARKTTATEEKS